MANSRHVIKPLLLVGLLMALLTLMSGCLRAYVDPGPNPARLTVSVKAAVQKSAVDAYKQRAWRSVTGPYWVWWVYKLDGKGVYQFLKPEGDGPQRWQGAYEISETHTFLVQPGNYKVRLRATAYLDHEERGGDRGGITYRSVPIADWTEDIVLNVGPGGSQNISRDFGVK